MPVIVRLLENMVEKVGGKARLAKTAAELASAEKIILPGVGSFDNGMRRLNTLGFTEALRQKVVVEKRPLLAICLGMQLLTSKSEEGTIPVHAEMGAALPDEREADDVGGDGGVLRAGVLCTGLIQVS